MTRANLNPDSIQPTTDELPEPLSWEEICTRYPNQWVVLVDIDWLDADGEFRRARVLEHGVEREGTLRRANPVRAGFMECIHDYTGSPRVIRAIRLVE